MMPSLRLVMYSAVGALFWIGAAVLPGFFVVALLYNLVLILGALLDWLLSPAPQAWEISREVSAKMNLGVPNSVQLLARLKPVRGGVQALPIVIRDETPLGWQIEDVQGKQVPVPRLRLNPQPGQKARGEYSVIPTRRGDFSFGSLSARYPTVLGLWLRQFTREAEETVRVYPDTTEVARYELRLRQGRLRDIGLHLLKLRGQGAEFESLREYSTGDEYKSINWKASARRGKLIATNYEIERDQNIIIAIDCGRMMTALADAHDRKTPEASLDTIPLSKLDCAINATVLLAHVAASMGDAVGLLLFSDQVLTFVPPRKGRAQTGTLIEALYSVQPTVVEPDYRSAYEHLIARKLRRALVVTFTDLIDREASQELLLASGALRRHHNPLCVTINNRDVIEMAEAVPESTTDLYSKAMAMQMQQQRAQALRELSQRGVGILDVQARDLTVATVNRYFDLKARQAL